MAGILDNKTRIMDVILTEEGKRQLHDGFMRVEYASFTDKETFYEGSITSGTADASSRIFLEATGTPVDKISLETDDTGKLINWEGSTASGSLELASDGTLYHGSSKMRLEAASTTTAFASLSETFFENVTENFKNQRLLSTLGFKLTSSFVLSADKFDLEINDHRPLPAASVKTIDIGSIEPLFAQSRLAHTPQFRYLAPRWLSPTTDPGIGLCGDYTRLQDTSFMNFTDILEWTALPGWSSSGVPVPGGFSYGDATSDEFMRAAWKQFMDGDFDDDYADIRYYSGHTGEWVESGASLIYVGSDPEHTGAPYPKPNQKITFDQTSDDNNILCQFFEVDTDEKRLLKLDVVDAGYIVDVNFGTGQIYFVGKVYTDVDGYPSFINIFTLVFT